jgi:pimeloyl-ACP methyl ester carboxylesterase
MASILEARKTPTTLGIHGVLFPDRKDAFGSATTYLNTFPNHESSSMSITRRLYGKDRDTFNGKANELLEAIRIERDEVESRPILLLGHSMGGL